MAVKKIGKAKADIETGLWCVEAKPERFIMNQRLVESRPDIKALKSAYSKHASKHPPSVRRSKEREEHHQHQKDLKAEIKKAVTQIYEEILQDSFTEPVPLRKDRDFEHKSDWRYCLYQGIIYQFDKPGCRGDEMIQQITDLQNRQAARSTKQP